jgi:thioester reductase-like protein
MALLAKSPRWREHRRQEVTMKYHLLTGATGLLGRYLVRDLLAAGVRLAVVVRPGKAQTSEDRLEAIMAHWERQAGHCLPRPVVLGGDLCQPGLGLAPHHARWIADHCEAVIHSAASMTFRPDNRGEPWQTNVEGARNLLNFCVSAGLRRFHHISTAYVCGLREGRVFETELDVGQKLGNVYEESKIGAEKMLREGRFESLTVYRPASIVGDSQNGFTSSYHGFYLPLQLAYVFSGELPAEKMDERFSAGLGLAGGEGKNFVPVDWVAAAITYLVTHPEWHGQTYHIASPKPVTVQLFQRVVQDAIRRFMPHRIVKEASEKDIATYERLFYDQMLIYRSHWRDDPIFDLTNTARALPHLPCPEMDYDLLMRVARYPIEKNFGLSKYEAVQRPIQAQKYLDRFLCRPAADGDSQECVALQVNGSGGGQWHFVVHDGVIVGADLGLGSAHAPRCYLNSATFAALTRGEMTVEQSINAGRVVLRAPRGIQQHVIRVLEQLVSTP